MFHVRDLGIHGNPERLAPASGVDWRGHQMPWANTYMLPQTRRVANVQRAHARGDFVAITQQVQRTVCGVLNIPESVFSNTSSVKAGVNLVEMSIMYTVNKHERTLARKVLQPVYDHSIARLFRNELAHLGLKPMLKHKDKYEDAPTREQISEDSLFTEGASWNVTFAFDLPPATTPEHLQHMYDEGIIGRRVYAESMLRVNHMGSDKRNPLDTDDEKDDANERRQRLTSKHTDARQRAPKGRKNLRSGIQKRTGRNFTTPSRTLAQSHDAQSTRHKDRHEDALR